MMPWLECLAALATAAGGAGAGWWLGRRGPWHLALGYGASLVLIVMIAVARRVPELALLPPWRWLMAGRIEFAVMGAAMLCLGCCLWPRMTSVRAQNALGGLLIVALGLTTLPAFVVPAVLQRQYRTALPAGVDADGICRQHTSFTCGPAAAVTALHQLGLETTEGEAAVFTRACPLGGTDESMLVAGLRQRYAAAGLRVELRRIDSLLELQGADAAILIIQVDTWTDHYVAVRRVTPTLIEVGNPATGRRVYDPAIYWRICRPVAILLWRKEGAPPLAAAATTG
jgi:hypothetical protein